MLSCCMGRSWGCCFRKPQRLQISGRRERRIWKWAKMPHKAVDEAPVTKKFVTQHIMIPVPQMPYNPSGMVTIPKDEDHKAKEELCSKQNSARSRKQRQQQLPTIYEDPEIEVSGAEDELYPLQDSAETSQQLKLQAVAHVAVAQEELCLLQGSAKSSQHRQLLQAIAKTPGTQDHKAKEEMCPLQTSVEESQQQKLQVTDETPQAEICKAVEKVYPLKYFAEESRQQQLKAVNAPPQVQDHQFKKEPFPLQCSAVATEQHLKAIYTAPMAQDHQTKKDLCLLQGSAGPCE